MTHVWGWGKFGSDLISVVPIQLIGPPEASKLYIDRSHSYIWSQASAYSWTSSLLQAPTLLPSIRSPSQISVFQGSTLVLHQDGSVSQPLEEVSSLVFPTKISMISCGREHGLALDCSGKVFAWGEPSKGRLGNPSVERFASAPVLIPGLENIKQIACGYRHSLALDRSGNVFAWGSGADGRLGIASHKDTHTPTFVPLSKRIAYITCGYLHSALLTSTGELLTFGFNGYGQLGLGHTNTLSEPGLCYALLCTNIIAVACGAFYTICVSNDGSIYSMGLGNKGQLGNGGYMNAQSPMLLSVSIEPVSSFKSLFCAAEMSIILCCELVERKETGSLSTTATTELYEYFSESAEFSFRPGNLPAKDPSEAAVHRKMVERQSKLYLEKIQEKELAEKRKQEEKLLKENRIVKSMQDWERNLAQWEQVKNSKSVKKLVYLGIPPKFRGEVWFRMAGNPLSITQEYFNINLAKARKIRNGELIGKENSLKLIELDIARTFSAMGYFQKGSPLQIQLQNLLEVFIVARPDIGYLQGMSYLGGILVLNLDIYKTFVLFVSIVTSPAIFPFFRVDYERISSIFSLFWTVFKDKLPELCEHFEMAGIQPQMFLFEWFATLFSRSLNQDVVARVWDIYFHGGPTVLYKTALAILKLLSYLLLSEGLTGIMKLLGNIGDFINDGDVLVEQIQSMELPAAISRQLSSNCDILG